jgi:hypothetical protein
MSRFLRLMAISLMLLSGGYQLSGAEKLPMPPQGVVPDENTAVKIAEAVFPPVFGQEIVDKFRPYQAQLKDGVWTVYGTLKPGSRGGTPMIRIRKQDAKVLGVWHSG